jgi:hypothetical protein
MLDYKSPNIASRATPIGSAEREPDRDEIIILEMKQGQHTKLRLRSQQDEERLLPSGARKVNLKSEIL